MNENERNDLFNEDNGENLQVNGDALLNADNELPDAEPELIPEPWQPEEFIPVKEIPEASQEDTGFSEAEALSTAETPETVTKDFADNQSADLSEQDNERTADEDTVFNPYAPKNPYTVNGAGDTVNPSYGQPVNSQRPGMSGGYPTDYGYNNQGYYQTPPKNSSGGGKKAAITIVVICVAVALIALVSSFFGGNEKPQTSTTTAPHSAIPTETTLPTTIPPVETTTTSPSQQQSSTAVQTTAPTTAEPTTQVINSIWVAEKVRPSVVGVLAYQQGELAGEGSGVLMNESEDGEYTYIVTCAHVINEPGCEFAILLLDGTSYEAEVVALDERTDIGVLKVKATGPDSVRSSRVI